MKKTLSLLLLTCCTYWSVSAQSPAIAEPDFIGEVITILPDSTTVQLEKENIMMRTRANASAVIFGIGKAKTKLIIENPSASVRLSKDTDITFIVRAVDNNSDPISIINIFCFEATGKRRIAEVASASSFGSIKADKLDRLDYKAKKFGNSSYLITLSEKPVGEFGITVQNPNHTDQKSIIVSTFAIE